MWAFRTRPVEALARDESVDHRRLAWRVGSLSASTTTCSGAARTMCARLRRISSALGLVERVEHDHWYLTLGLKLIIGVGGPEF
jgi:hypothetical protein